MSSRRMAHDGRWTWRRLERDAGRPGRTACAGPRRRRTRSSCAASLVPMTCFRGVEPIVGVEVGPSLGRSNASMSARCSARHASTGLAERCTPGSSWMRTIFLLDAEASTAARRAPAGRGLQCHRTACLEPVDGAADRHAGRSRELHDGHRAVPLCGAGRGVGSAGRSMRRRVNAARAVPAAGAPVRARRVRRRRPGRGRATWRCTAGRRPRERARSRPRRRPSACCTRRR